MVGQQYVVETNYKPLNAGCCEWLYISSCTRRPRGEIWVWTHNLMASKRVLRGPQHSFFLMYLCILHVLHRRSPFRYWDVRTYNGMFVILFGLVVNHGFNTQVLHVVFPVPLPTIVLPLINQSIRFLLPCLMACGHLWRILTRACVSPLQAV